LKKALTCGNFEIRIDQNFRKTMEACAKSTRPGQESTWIEPEMIDDYEKLHQMGIAHSIEAWHEGKQVGGLYGLAFGKMFFGESMFHQVPEASKVCLAHLASLSQKYGIEMIDCQAHTPHLEKMGAREIPRIQFCADLSRLLKNKESVIPWKGLSKSSTLARFSEN
jgi:leucyl/phenylalanyl-tRNA--protein transferase